ncbi:hypothetical protein [Asticcacaulis sp. AC402]|uniref:hypothetical protein n=1 Tax=Asticcacaulis sp. AC402 TaxID=1282361 RepID=UPI0003C40D49|nr:hypothetical protein [Asticcacaulis sp. AC402]ESQ73503.1 hypothetical protein ABAC402_18880 [Asticcacaulis sp. AC402]
MSRSSKLQLHAFVARGPKAGTVIYPHEHQDGSFVVSMTRFAKDYVYLRDPDDIPVWLEKGYRLRMSNKDAGVPAASLIVPSKIFRPGEP